MKRSLLLLAVFAMIRGTPAHAADVTLAEAARLIREKAVGVDL